MSEDHNNKYGDSMKLWNNFNADNTCQVLHDNKKLQQQQ
jgi:hypothetical protein